MTFGSRQSNTRTNSAIDGSFPETKKPKITRKGVLIASGVWFLYSFVSAFPLQSNANILFIYAFSGQLNLNLILGLFSVLPWLIVVSWMDAFGWSWKILAHILLAPIYAFAVYYFYIGMMKLYVPMEAVRSVTRASEWIIFGNMTSYFLQFAFYHTVVTLKRLRLKEQQTKELLALAKEQELSTLKAQLNPHFFFNTLNSINAMVSQSPEETRVMIAQLADLLRYAIDISKKNLVPLGAEIEFVKAYLALESKRFGERLQVEYRIDDTVLNIPVLPMVLQPLVENAVKHGIGPSEEGGKIIITIQRSAKTIDIVVQDSGVGFSGTSLSSSGNGTGLQNTDARLRKQFGESSALWTKSPTNGGFEVGFSLPINIGDRV